MINEAIIIAGGKGSRLKSVVKDIPKPMADINGKPFLEYLLRYLSKYDIRNVILAVGYKYEIIKKHFRDNFRGMEIIYSIESEPLGTGGAISRSIELTSTNPILILNGDTLFKINYSLMLALHEKFESNITIGLKEMADVGRFGVVKVKNNKIISFEEKFKKGCGLINTGVYIIKRDIFNRYKIPDVFSFERDFLSRYVKQLKPSSYISNDYFVDIGVPESYKQAKDELS